MHWMPSVLHCQQVLYLALLKFVLSRFYTNLKKPRGVYGGAVGYIDFSGNMDVCIGIRMAMNKGGKVYVRAGAGIVRDSVPASEYNETLMKGQSMISAITDAQEVE